MSSLRIFGGRVVTPGGVREADVVVASGVIATVEPASGEGDLDAHGCLVLPGGVDPHSHLLSGIVPASVSALRGGTTTALTFTAPRAGETPAAAYRRALVELVPMAAIEVGLHPSIWEPDLLTDLDREELVALGARTIKHFLGYPELGMMTSDRTLYESLRHGSQLGLLTLVHCENGGAIDARVHEAVAAGRTGVRAFVWARDPELEAEAVTRTLALARVADAPVYLVHLSTADSLELVRGARARGQRVWAEACTHHLLLDDSVYARADAERFLVVPPLRPPHDVDALWNAVADGTIDTIGSDHAQVAYQPPFPPDDFRGLPYGFPGAELRVPLVLSEGARRGVPLERLVDALATAPAKIFGLAPRKGAIVPGADADLVVWDPERARGRVARRARRLSVRGPGRRRANPAGCTCRANRVGAVALRIGIVGAGWIATDHRVVLEKLGHEVAAVCDVDRDRADALTKGRARVYDDWQAMLAREELNALWVATPPLHHRAPAVAALERGIPVYLEKPIARTLDDARAIVEAWELSGTVCAVGYQWHATEALEVLRRELAGQELALLLGISVGPTASRPWFLDRSGGGGNVLERGSHQLDLIRAVGGDAVSAQTIVTPVLLAQGEGEHGDIEDAATLILRLASGATATIVVAWTRQGQPGMYSLDAVASEATLHLELDPWFKLSGRVGEREVECGMGVHPFERSVARFLEAAQADDQSLVFCTPRNALGTLATALACERSLLEGGRVVALAEIL